TISQVAPAVLAQGVKVVIVLDVPMVQYYLYLLDGAINGHISCKQCLAWYDEVELRCKRVVALCRQRLRALLGSNLYYQLQVITSNELDDVAIYLRERMEDGIVPTLHDLIQVKMRSADPIWEALLGLGHPQTVQVFNGRSYSAALFRHSTS